MYSWSDDFIFGEEPLRPASEKAQPPLPPLLERARSLQKSLHLQPGNTVFLEQGRLLANYEDDYKYHGDPVRYFPTYQSFTDDELRGYFAWRTRVRKNFYPTVSLSFIFLYVYELINQIGVNNPLEGYAKLRDINRLYGPYEPKLEYHLNRWMTDYVVYYGLDPGLLADSSSVTRDQCAGVLENISAEPQDCVMAAIKQLAPAWLSRSRFYAEYFEHMDALIYRVLLAMNAHYARGHKKSMVDQFFGARASRYTYMFSRAVFCDPLKLRDYEYHVDAQRIYRCQSGIWSIESRRIMPQALRRLDKLLKTVDAILREEWGYGHPIRKELDLKWLDATIRQEAGTYLAEKTTQKKIEIDFSRLGQIRADAAITQEKLIVDEEEEQPGMSLDTDTPKDNDLEPHEYRLLQCLLYGGDLDWLRKEGHLVAVVVDSVNEKLYERFGDSILDDIPSLVEDYIEELKEMIHP